MRSIFILALLCSLFTGCGTSPSSGNSGTESRANTFQDDSDNALKGLNGKPLPEFVSSAVKVLSAHPSRQNRAALARSLDKKWKLNCNERCQISERN